MSEVVWPLLLWAAVLWASCMSVAVAVRAASFPNLPWWRYLRWKWIDQYLADDAVRRFDERVGGYQ